MGTQGPMLHHARLSPLSLLPHTPTLFCFLLWVSPSQDTSVASEGGPGVGNQGRWLGEQGLAFPLSPMHPGLAL